MTAVSELMSTAVRPELYPNAYSRTLPPRSVAFAGKENEKLWEGIWNTPLRTDFARYA